MNELKKCPICNSTNVEPGTIRSTGKGPQTRAIAFGKGSQVRNSALGDPNPTWRMDVRAEGGLRLGGRPYAHPLGQGAGVHGKEVIRTTKRVL